MVAGGVVVAGECVADQHRVCPARVQFAVGFVDELIAGQLPAAGKRQWLGEAGDLGGDNAEGSTVAGGGHQRILRVR